jgi:alpha/beta superfamily hydrolase
MMDFSFLQNDKKTKLVIAGEWDTFGPLAEVQQVFGAMTPPPPIRIIPEADHFFNGEGPELARVLGSFIEEYH